MTPETPTDPAPSAAEVKERLKLILEDFLLRAKPAYLSERERNDILESAADVRAAIALLERGELERERLAQAETVLAAWQQVFGTTQLSHAIARLEKAERDAARAPKEGTP